MLVSLLRGTPSAFYKFTRPSSNRCFIRAYRPFRSEITKHHPPLRILFCGSDEFSTASLKHLHAAKKDDPSFIQSIDVVYKQGKPSGRGLKKIRDVPIKDMASELNLPTHEIATFTGWTPPVYGDESMSLVIAVSFGLLVPPRILNLATYGGMNVHPSLLPAFRGPAPLQHTLLNGLRQTGISVQTLHPQKFDHGHILAQDAFELSPETCSSFLGLREYMGERGAELLLSTLRQGSFIPPFQPLQDQVLTEPSEAPKLAKEHAHIDWRTWSADYIMRAQKAMGTLWSVWPYEATNKDTGAIEHKSLRIQWHNLHFHDTERAAIADTSRPGTPLILDQVSAAVMTSDGHQVLPGSITIEGKKRGWPGNSVKAIQFLQGLSKSSSESCFS